MIFGTASAEKQRIAEEVASMLKLSVDIDTSSSERLVSLSVCARMLVLQAGNSFFDQENEVLIRSFKPSSL